MTDQELADKIMEAEGYESEEMLAEECLFGAGHTPNICRTCHSVGEGEPDATENWCDVCGTNTCVSFLVLVGLI